MDVRAPARRLRRPRLRLAAVLALAALAALAASPASAQDLKRPASQTEPPAFYEMSAREVIAAGDRRAEVREQRRRHGALFAVAYTKGAGMWQVSYFSGGAERVQVLVHDRSGRVLEAWTGHQVRWRMARGYEGAFGRKLNAPYVWIPLCVLFLLPFVDPRRPFRLLHLDLLVLVGLSASTYFFNRGDIGVSVPLVYPVLAYLLVRMLVAGFRRARAPGRLFPLFPVAAVALGLVFLVGFRVALNVTDSRVIDVGQSSVVGADRIADGDELYGQPFSKTDQHGDTYGPVTYLLYVPFEQVLPFDGKPDPPAAHAAAIAFDLLVILGLLLLGRRLRGWPLGVALAYAWAANPYSLYVMQSNANDTAVAMLLVWALVLLGSPAGRGALGALAAAAKFSPAALLPLLAHNRSPRRIVAFSLAVAGVAAATFLPFLPDGGFREIYDRTIGFQLARESPFSVWGQEGALGPVHTALKIGVALLALAVAFLPRRRDAVQVAALAAAVVIGVQLVVTHWFYLYVVWFLPLVLVALLAPLAAGRREPLGPGLGLDTRRVDDLGDQPVPAGAGDQLE